MTPPPPETPPPAPPSTAPSSADGLPFSHPFRIAALPARKPTHFDLRPGPEAEAAIAAALGIVGLEGLRLRGSLRPAGRRDWLLEGALEAGVTQACVISLAPVATRIAETVTRRYVAGLAEPSADEVEMSDETVEPLGAVIDAGAVMVEALSLALPDYPRAEGVDFAPAEARPDGVPALAPEERMRPFAGLSELLKKPGATE